MKRLSSIASASLIIVTLLGGLALAQDSQEMRTRGLFTSGKSDGMRILILMEQGGMFVPVDPSRDFKQGDRIRVSFESNFDGYVYIVNVMPSGKKRLLFPSARLSDSNKIIAHKRYDLPSTSFEFDAEKGTEILQVIMSRTAIPYLEAALKNPEGELGASASSAAAELSSNTPTPKRGGIVTENVAIVLPQTGPDKVRTRGIILAPGKEKDQEGSVVAIPDQKGKGGHLKPGEVAVFEIRLRHI
jgi:hypothetical protein